MISLGELMLSPMGLSLVSKVAPVRMRGLMMGGWFVATAIGNKLTAIGLLWTRWYHSSFWLLCSVSALFMAFVLLAAAPPAEAGHARRLRGIRLRTSTETHRGHCSMRLVLTILTLLLLAAPAVGRGRPMTVDDLLAVKAVSDPQVSPDGKWVVYVVAELDRARQDEQRPLARPRGRRRAETTDHRAGRRQPSPLEPRRQDHRLHLEPRRLGAGLAPAARRRRGPAAHQAADRRLGPDLVAQGGQDRLHRRGLPRHDPRGDRGEGQGEGGVQEQGPDLRPPDDPPLGRVGRGEAEPPVRRRREDRRGEGPDPQARGQHPPCPVRRLERYAFSPDGKELAFTAEPIKDLAWSTNTDIWTVPVEGGEPKNLTEANPGADAQPAYSPDGKRLAYVSQARAGFESDQWVLTCPEARRQRRPSTSARTSTGRSSRSSGGHAPTR